MTVRLRGGIDWDVSRDRDGHRDYSLAWLAISDDLNDGPAQVLACPELPIIGSWWQWGNDFDFAAYCSPETKVKAVISKEPNRWWIIEQVFTTRPFYRCSDSAVENPLLEPTKISGTFNPEKIEAFFDRHGKPIVNSTGIQPYTGKAVEFDASKPTVKIGMNLPFLPLELFAPMMHTINDSYLWGCPPRCVKLSNVTWSRQIYGSCNFFYPVEYEFDIDFNGFDRRLYDFGNLYLREDNDPDNPVDENNPADYEVYKSKRGERPSGVFLDGHGKLLTDKQNPVMNTIEYYPEGNLLLLGIPSTLA